MEWQPIETAPRDGTVVWAYGLIPGAYGYTEDRHDMVKARVLEGSWTFAQPMGRYDPIYWSPAKWMPLPEPPA